MIKLTNISKIIDRKNILKNLNIHIPRGEITAICGPNGAGKTTLLRIILDLLCIDSGTINYNIKKSDISFLFHEECLFQDLTLKENLDFFLASKNLEFDPRKMVKYAEELNIVKEIDKKISTFSEGMIRKADLIRTLMEEPELLILDEPTSNLDPIGKVNVRNILKKKVNEENLTVFLTSHLLSEVEKLAKHVYIINEGQNCWEGDMEYLKKNNIDLESKFVELIKSKELKHEKTV